MLLKIIAISLFSLSLFGQSISWQGDYDNALEKAHKQKKDLLIFITTSKHKISNKVLGTFFKDKEQIQFINENFISILINVQYKTSYPIELFYTTKFPSIFFASYKDESFLTHPLYGVENKIEFDRVLEELKKTERTNEESVTQH